MATARDAKQIVWWSLEEFLSIMRKLDSEIKYAQATTFESLDEIEK